MSDFAYALRLLRRSPFFAGIAVLTLALGIGGTTAMFSLVDGVLIRPLPYPEPERLVHVWKAGPRLASPMASASYPDFVDYRERQRSLSAMAVYRYWTFTLAEGDQPESLFGISTSPSLFDVLKVPAHVGRTFRAGDDEPGRDSIVVLSFALWQRRFSSDTTLVGRTVRLDGKPMTVVGVMPPAFTFPMTTPTTGSLATRPMDFWVPMPVSQQVRRRDSHSFWVVARLAPGVTLDQARDDLARVGDQLASEYPTTNRGTTVSLDPLDAHLVRSARTGLLVLSGAVLFVLLIACVNVANLTLARATVREREMAIRAAVGAGRGRLRRQMLCESLTVGLLGGAVGALLSWWSLPVIRRLAPEVPRLSDVTLDWRALVVTLLTSLAVGTIVGLLPARQAAGNDLTMTIKRTAGGSGRSGPMASLVISEVAISMLLLSGGGLLLRSFVNLLNVDLGFSSDRILTGWIMRPTTTFGDLPAQARFFDEVVQRIEALPDVSSVGAVNALPLTLVGDGTGVSAAGIEAPVGMDRRKITPAYFRTLSITLQQGREFDARDASDAPHVAILSRRAADRLWPGASAIGRQISLDGGDGPRSRTIVGIVDDVRHVGMDVPVRQTVYLPLAQAPEPFMQIAVRTAGDPAGIAPAVARAIASVDPAQAIFNVAPLDHLVSDALGPRRFHLTVIGGFALFSLILAAVGLYGVVSYAVTNRGREIGIRVAMGATPRAVLWMFFRQGFGWVAAGTALGCAISLAASQALASMLFDVRAGDPLVLAVTAALLVIVAACAIYLPARKTLTLDPLEALRAE